MKYDEPALEIIDFKSDIRTIIIHQSPGSGDVDPYSSGESEYTFKE